MGVLWDYLSVPKRAKLVHLSLTKLKDSDEISRSVYMCFKCSGCVFVFTRNFFCYVIKSEVSVMGQRSGQFHSLLYP